MTLFRILTVLVLALGLYCLRERQFTIADAVLGAAWLGACVAFVFGW